MSDRPWGQGPRTWEAKQEAEIQARQLEELRRLPRPGSYAYRVEQLRRHPPQYPYTLLDRLTRCPKPFDPNPEPEPVTKGRPLNLAYAVRHHPQVQAAQRQGVAKGVGKSLPLMATVIAAIVALVWLEVKYVGGVNAWGNYFAELVGLP